MTRGERVEYFTKAWPAAARVKGWAVKDDAKRRAVAVECMRLVGGPLVTTSDKRFGRDEVTALFCYLDHLANPACLDRSAAWDTCQQDYKTYNRAKQADWHERKLYGQGKNKLDRDRFQGATSAAGGPLDDLDPEEVRKRHMTFASRHKKKRAEERRATKAAAPAPAAPMPTAAVIAGNVMLAPWHEAPAEVEQEPAYAGPEGDDPF